MIHENDIGRVDLSPDYLTLCNRYFIRETSLRTAILGEKSFGVASNFFMHNFICFHKNFEVMNFYFLFSMIRAESFY